MMSKEEFKNWLRDEREVFVENGGLRKGSRADVLLAFTTQLQRTHAAVRQQEIEAAAKKGFNS